jgi:hypothetical protein
MSLLKDAASYEKRVLKPTVLETKEQLLVALRSGAIKTSKYNLLTEEEKLFVELIAFGDYSPETAMRAVNPDIGTYAASYARRLMSKKEVIDTIEELTEAKDKSFRASLARTRELALKKAEYIMINSNDEAIQLQAAKLILDKSNEMTKMKADSEDKVSGIRINIAVDEMVVKPSGKDIIIPMDDKTIEAEYETLGKKPPVKTNEKPIQPINPETGLPYTIRYEGVNSYEDEEDE